MVFNVSKRVESGRKRVNHQRLRLSCPEFHVRVVELSLSHDSALCPAAGVLAGFSEHGPPPPPPLGNRVPPDTYRETWCVRTRALAERKDVRLRCLMWVCLASTCGIQKESLKDIESTLKEQMSD